MLSKEIFNLKKTLDNLVNQQKKIKEIINILSKCLKNNKNIFICGNGGSAAEAEHLSAEFLVRLKPKNNRRSLPIISLTQNSPVVTACGNDYGFDNIFSRQVEALARKEDVLIVSCFIILL